MGRINVLDKHLAELIAAGEVVERPASVVKELLENCIDAKAKTVTVEIQNGGITLIRVTDNGIGISRDDVPKAFLRNATSKVSNQDDLEKIATLGFRGEALASISAVAKVELLTKVNDEELGTRYEIEGGEEITCEDCGTAQGTTIIVRDIFYNTPARMKFLKKNVSEANAVAAVVDRIALSYPQISFKFIRDGKQTLNTLGDGKISSCIYSVYGKSFLDSLMPLEYELSGVHVNGFISKPTAARATRSMQHFFINSRYVRTRTAMAALEEAYKGSMMVGKFPACVLYINVPFEAVDVNVHPAKTEVRFIDERPIFEAVYHGVKSALNKDLRGKVMTLVDENETETKFVNRVSNEKSKVNLHDRKDQESELTFNDISSEKNFSGLRTLTNITTVPKKISPIQSIVSEKVQLGKSGDCDKKIETDVKKHDLLKKELDEEEPEIFIPRTVHYDAVVDREKDKILNKSDVLTQSDRNTVDEKKLVNEKVVQQLEFNSIIEDVSEKIPSAAKIQGEVSRVQTKVVGEIFNTYIVVQYENDKMILIDKHAAHERMLYEKLKEGHPTDFAQMLLTPVTVVLEKGEFDAVVSNAEILNEAGFDVEAFGSGSVIVRSAPMYFTVQEIPNAIVEIAGYLMKHNKNISTQKKDWLFHNIACRAAIKGGTPMKLEEMIDFVKKLEQNPQIKFCPHGRPVSIILNKKEIEKKFGRIQ